MAGESGTDSFLNMITGFLSGDILSGKGFDIYEWRGMRWGVNLGIISRDERSNSFTTREGNQTYFYA
jgi:hypothetical protein